MVKKLFYLNHTYEIFEFVRIEQGNLVGSSIDGSLITYNPCFLNERNAATKTWLNDKRAELKN